MRSRKSLWMKLVDVAELELDRRADVVEADDLGVFADDLQAALDLAPVVVGQLQDEQVFKDIATCSYVSSSGNLSRTSSCLTGLVQRLSLWDQQVAQEFLAVEERQHVLERRGDHPAVGELFAS